LQLSSGGRQKTYIVLPKEFPSDAANLSDSELQTVPGGANGLPK
jgi:hypothetical protein